MNNILGRIKCFSARLFSSDFWRLNHVVSKKIKDHCIMFLPASSGDSLLVLANLKRIEEDSGVLIFPVIKRSQAVIPELLCCSDYLLYDDYSVFYALPAVKVAYHCIFGSQIRAKMRPQIKAGTLFLAHPDKYPESVSVRNHAHTMAEMYMSFLNLRKMPIWPASVGRITSSIDISVPAQTIMLCPQTASFQDLPHIFWFELARTLNDLGWNVCYNTIEPVNYLPNAKWLNCSLRDAVAIGQNVAFVIALRSGICDLLANIGSRLIAIYPDLIWENGFSCFETFDLNKFFSRNDIGSCIYTEKEKVLKYISAYVGSP